MTSKERREETEAWRLRQEKELARHRYAMARPELCYVARYNGPMTAPDCAPLHLWTLTKPLHGLLVGSTYAEDTLAGALAAKAAYEDCLARERLPRTPHSNWREGPHDDAMYGPLRSYEMTKPDAAELALAAKVQGAPERIAKRLPCWIANMGD